MDILNFYKKPLPGYKKLIYSPLKKAEGLLK
jgi:hypothetical protein